MSTKAILGYWDVRGIAQPIRILLAYLNVDFEDRRYSWELNDGRQWFGVKHSLGFDFPNVPYFIDCDLKLTHSVAILQYLARKYKLYGATDQEKSRIDVLEQVLEEYSEQYYNFIGKSNLEDLKSEYLESVQKQLESICNFLGSGPYVIRDKISYVDFLLYEYLVRISLLAPELFENFDEFGPYVKQIEELPKVAEYLKVQEPTYLNGPLGVHYWNAKY